MTWSDWMCALIPVSVPCLVCLYLLFYGYFAVFFRRIMSNRDDLAKRLLSWMNAHQDIKYSSMSLKDQFLPRCLPAFIWLDKNLFMIWINIIANAPQGTAIFFFRDDIIEIMGNPENTLSNVFCEETREELYWKHSIKVYFV